MKIRKMTAQDIIPVYDLIMELAIYEKAPEQVTNTHAKMLQDGFSENPIFEGIVAEDETGKIVGIAIYYIRYSTWKGKCIYLEDIVVTESCRGKGVGKLLFDEVMRITLRHDGALLVWQVLEWNEPAINFYKKYQANLDPEWINGKLTKDQITSYFAKQ
jgi:GNAT superfamily N-acetyltransferase